LRAQDRSELSERPGDWHGVSSNASMTEAVKLLAVFVMEGEETQLTTPLEN
jgi:quercetin dioxygenase-like cupin family protein